ncbi:hypothetical protein FG379_001412 [Cryptosporidium bovis]|uniref:uncharacterized protein n=1 Tax=Cryptosporidium bovis TaxID=310047 RepID=UPI00351A0CBB|nr:hypothetical protein FG379_001412 [Cryptosporidium bovis]
MHLFGAKNRSITPVRQPFETQISENNTYRSIGRWRSKFSSANDDDYLSPSFLDDASSLSSSPLFHDDTPRTVTSSNISPSGNTFDRSEIHKSTSFNSNENTPLNNRIFRKYTSTGTPIFTSPTKTTLDDEGFTIPDLPGSTRRKSTNNNRVNNSSTEFHGNNVSDSVHIIMPPRLGFPSQTPLNLKDQYKKSPLPIVSANLDYRTTYMGQKLAIRANETRNRSEFLHETLSFQDSRRLTSENRYSRSPSVEHVYVDEDDYVLHHGELLRSKYLSFQKPSNSRSYNTRLDSRSRSLSSYYLGNNYNYLQSPGYRSNSVAMKYSHHSTIGNLNSFKVKRRRIGSYIASNDELLQQHIQLIDKSLERCSKESDDSSLNPVNLGLIGENQSADLVDLKGTGANYLKEFDSTDRKVQSKSNIDIEKLSDITSDNYNNQLIGVEKVSSKLIKRKSNNSPRISVSRSEVQTEESCFVGEFENIEPNVDLNVNYEERINHPNEEELSINEMELELHSPNSECRKKNNRGQSPKSCSSLEEIIPRPISHSESVQIQDSSNISSLYVGEFGVNDSKNASTKSVKPKKYRGDKVDGRAKSRNFSRKKHIDYHIPIDQVKPHRSTIQKHISEDCSIENLHRRYPKRLRTAPLKWYLGERLEYHRDEKSELGYTIAAIHKVANPTMLPNERGSIYPVDENAVELSRRSSFETENSVRANSHVAKPKKCQYKAPRVRKDKGKNISESNKVENGPSVDNPNAVILRNNETDEEFTMMAVFDRSSLCWADVEYSPGKPYSVALSFISSQATCCEICLPPLTEKGLDESQDNYILGHVYMAPDNKSLQIMISDNNVYNIGTGDWFLIPDNTNYNFSNTSDHSEIFISLYVIKES